GFGIGDRAVGDGGHGRGGSGHAESGEDDQEHGERQDDVYDRSPGHNDQLLPPRFAVEEPAAIGFGDVFVFGLACIRGQLGKQPGVGVGNRVGAVLIVGRKHADQFDVPAQRYGFEAVFELAAPPRPQSPAETHEILRDFDAEKPGRQQMSQLVQRDRRDDADNEDDNTEGVDHGGHAAISCARSLAQLSAPATAAIVSSRVTTTGSAICSARTAETVSTMPGNANCPERKALTHTSFAALNTAGPVRPKLPARRARATAGNADSSRGANCQDVADVQSHPGAAPSTRSGHARAKAMGSRMSGGEACAMVAPSTNSTIE